MLLPASIIENILKDKKLQPPQWGKGFVTEKMTK